MWLKDALEASCRRLSLPEIVGLEEQSELIALGEDATSRGALERAVFLIVMCSEAGEVDSEIAASIERFLARPAQTKAFDYLIPLVTPVEGRRQTHDAASAALQNKLTALSTHWIPTLTRRADDETGSAWARVTEQSVALMARVLITATNQPPHDGEARTVWSPRLVDPQRALTSAEALVAEIDANQLAVHSAKEKLDTASSLLIEQCIDAATHGLASRRFNADEVQTALTQAADVYHDTLETIVEDAALQTLATARRAEGLRRSEVEAEAFVPRLDSVLSELYDSIAPDPVDDSAGEGDGAASLARLSRGRHERQIGAALGLMLGPLGVLVGGLIGAAREHRRKKEALTTAVSAQAEVLVDRARTFVDQALAAVDVELRDLKSEWQTRVNVLAPRADTSNSDLVGCRIFAPSSVQRGHSMFILVAFAPQEAVDGPSPLDPAAASTLMLRVPKAQDIGVLVRLQNGTVAAPVKPVTWQGREEQVGFTVFIDDATPVGECVATAFLSVAGVPLGQILVPFQVVDADRGGDLYSIQRTGRSARLYEYAFISFADDDYMEAADWSQALQEGLVPCVEGRFSTRLVDQWRETMLRSIDRCDLFLLCWSTFARESTWVQQEWERILVRSQAPAESGPALIAVMMQEGDSPPPQALAYAHFADAQRGTRRSASSTSSKTK